MKSTTKSKQTSPFIISQTRSYSLHKRNHQNRPSTMTTTMEPLDDQVFKLRRKVTGSISRRCRQRRRKSRRSQHHGSGKGVLSSCCDGSVVSGISSACSESIDILSASYGKRTITGTGDDSSSIISESQNTPVLCAEPIEEDIIKLTIDVPVNQYGDYRTINQNEFFKECMITDCGGSSVIHFFNENDPASIELDLNCKNLAQKYPACKFLRIDGGSAKFVCSKLGIDSFPTVLAIRNKVVLDRYMIGLRDGGDTYQNNIISNDFETWVLDSIPLINGP